jgi:hypothetical protein
MMLCTQILRWNWSRVVLALSFARSTASMAFALRFSILPLIDSLMHLAFEDGAERNCVPEGYQNEDVRFLTAEQAFDIKRSAINLQRFTLTKYFETALSSQSKPRGQVRKKPDS